MTAPKPNIVLADGTPRYVAPSGRLHLTQLLQAGDSGLFHAWEPSFSTLVFFELVEGVKQKGTNRWHWHLTTHGYRVAQQLTQRSDKQTPATSEHMPG